MKDTIIDYVDYGLGNRYEVGNKTIIELNKNLLKYPELHHSIIRHELQHTKKSFSYNDLKLDLSESKVSTWEVLKFMTKHPGALTQFLPFYFTRKYGFVYDLNLIIFYSIILVTFCIVTYLAMHI